ncbi:antitoxin VapB family protein [Halorhabdus salina]|uniref:antitoxin VapB family protein n=1 Tax=Halorhabdus salina TaxID=2750670 RepID=UPI0015EEAB2B|nr:antitoxin VapB family protein [Halorhabdus salina]
MSKSIRVEEETHATLAKLKGEEESFDELLSRLIEDRREAIHSGAGLWDGSDAARVAREKRRAMKEDVGR